MESEFPYEAIGVDTWATYVENGHVKEHDHVFYSDLKWLMEKEAKLRHIVYGLRSGGVGDVDIQTFESRANAQAYGRTLAELAGVEFSDYTVE